MFRRDFDTFFFGTAMAIFRKGSQHRESRE